MNFRLFSVILAGAAAFSVAKPALADISGFSGFAPVNISGMTKSVGFHASTTRLTLTDGSPMEAASAFNPTPQQITSWNAQFVYQAVFPSNSSPADGVAFVLQNDPRGVKALGSDGGALGYGQQGSIAKSAAMELDVYQASGQAVVTDGGTGSYKRTKAVDLQSGDPIQVTLTYDGSVLTETLHDLSTDNQDTTETAIDIPEVVGGDTALVGFTGGSGDNTAMQTIRDFSFHVLPNVPLALRKHILPARPYPVLPKTYKTLDDYVDPMIGTGSGPGGGCNVFPGPSAPFGMVQFSPDTSAPSVGYSYADGAIQGFSMTHMSGVGCSDDGDVFLTATTGSVETQTNQYQSYFSHRQESASPGYYQVKLLRFGINAQLTATTRAGLVKFTFPAGKAANILIPISHTLTATSAAKVTIIGHDEVDGQVTSQGFCGSPHSYTVYFILKVNRPFPAFGTWAGTAAASGTRTAVQGGQNAPAIGAYLRYPAGLPLSVTARIGISYVSVAGARANLHSEVNGRSFSQIHHQAASAWNKELSVLQIQGGTISQRTAFYTALYHALLMPSVFNDVDGKYLGFDNKIHHVAPGRMMYANYSGWDIYRTEVPLLALIAPKRLEDMCQSIVEDYKQGGWMPRWPQNNFYTDVMCGSPLTIALSTAWDDGLHGFDMQTAYQGMYKDATQAPPPGKPYGGESNIQYMNEVGYIPQDKEGYGSVSQTEEDCIAYASLAPVAQSLGLPGDANMLRRRALDYRNVFDPATRFMRPRMLNGSWMTPFDPTQTDGYVEGSGWHYRWLAPQDMAGLIRLMGGDSYFNAQLDQFFSYPHPEWAGQYYNPYNEPDLEAPFLYDYSGAPWKTQARVRELQADAYNTSPGGIPGNDDCGTMSSWYVLSAMGLYAVDPADSTYELTTPLFSKVTIHLQRPYSGKTFTISAPLAAAKNQYILSSVTDGKPWAKDWVPEKMIARGGSMTMTLGAQPGKTWGAAAADAPPSLTH